MQRTLFLAALALAGCGGSSQQTTSRSPQRPTLELTIRDPRHGFVNVGDLRGQVVILIVVSTYDTMSQVAITEVTRFAALREDVAFIGVLMQPGAEMLADAYVRAIDPGFPMGADADGVIESGASGLGTITTVPTIFALDRLGHVVARREGYQGERVLEAMVLDAEVRVPAEAVQQPPLVGTPAP